MIALVATAQILGTMLAMRMTAGRASEATLDAEAVADALSKRPTL